MSLILDSNQVASRNLGSFDSFDRDPNNEFDLYKARVIADGGVIVDENATKAAIMKLIDKGVYGLAKVFVGGSYGLKKDVNGNVIKLYSIGHTSLTEKPLDMTLFSIGLGKTVTNVNGEIVFSNEVKVGTSQTDGSVFATELTKAPEGKGWVCGVSGSYIKNVGSSEAGISGFTLLDKQVNVSPLWVATLSTSATIVGIKQTGIPNQNSNASTTRVQASITSSGARYTFFSDYINSKLKGYRDGALVTEPTAVEGFADLSGFYGYITLGGYITKTATATNAVLSNIKVKEFFIFDDLPESRLYLA
ncbi:hypothetical protein ACQUGU_06600 [Acinetobacter baumannii]|uniref:hypothetical protein n=1 Tax=Acinetobacter baumannii TaxID=470 RepID=UPI003FA3801E